MKPTRRMLTALAVGVIFAFNALPALAALTSVSGYAYSELITTTTASGTTVTSGPLPEVGPFKVDPSFDAIGRAESVSVSDLLSTSVLEVWIRGGIATGSYPGNVWSNAWVNVPDALSGTFTTPDQLYADCRVDGLGNTTAVTYQTRAVLAGTSLPDHPAPNTNVNFSTAFAGGTATLNEQFYDALSNELTVTAIHLHVTSGTVLASHGATAIDIYLAHVECDGLPGGNPPVIPEAPLALLLPLTALAILGGAIFLSRGGRLTLRSGR